jgi:hypothetical protein
LAKIVIKFMLGGAVEFHPQGFVGKTCHEATRPYVKAAGGKAQVTNGEQPLMVEGVQLRAEQQVQREVRL